MTASRNILILIMLLTLFSQGCREPFNVEVPSGNSLLVVDAMITDQPGPYMVKLSRSSALNSTDFPAESGAVVTLESTSGEEEVLEEAMDGYYFTSENGIKGIIGEQYRLSIQTGDQVTYQSDWELLKRTPAIDSVYFIYQEQDSRDGLLQGMQTFVDTHDPANDTRYYRYEWVESWQYRVPYSTPFEYLGNDNVKLIEEKETCWIEEPSSSINVTTTIQNQTDKVSRHPILFVTTQTPRLRIRYSLLLKQYALDEDEYFFWKNLKETVNEGGTLFDRQPQSITGNLHRIDSSEPVLGYFSASAISTERIFIDRRLHIPENVRVDASLLTQCMSDTFVVDKFGNPDPDAEVFGLINRGLVFHDFWRDFVAITGYIITTVPCSDCTYHGGTTEKPNYWID